MRLRAGFGIVELLVVLGVTGLLLGLLLPAVQHVRGAAQRIRCGSNLRQMGIALHNYHTHLGHFPPRRVDESVPNSDPNRVLGWMALILPHIEETSLYAESVRACALDPKPWHNPPHRGFETVIPLYVCPTDTRLLAPLTDVTGTRAAYASYLGIAGAAPPGVSPALPGVLGKGGTRIEDIGDGASFTIMVGERPPPDSLHAGWWYPSSISGDGRMPHGPVNGVRGPNSIIYFGMGTFTPEVCRLRLVAFGPGELSNPCDRYHLWSLHTGGANFLFADGAVRFLTYSAAERDVWAMATINAKEPVTLPD